ncbi:MAG: DUF2934 domain-containing protein [Bacteriovoracaceae bacterium]|nr:DUF2934 domain-containing protein [Bacteriovoracaceae bacterium]
MPAKKPSSSAAKKSSNKTVKSTTKAAPCKCSKKCISPEERQRLIGELAFKKAQARNFQNGSPEQDWYEAEREIDALYK